MTQYMISVHHAEGGPELTEAEMQQSYKQVDAFNDELQASGSWVFAGGPYAESKEQLGGFWVVEAPDLEAALELGKRGSAACMAPVQVRPFQGMPPAE